MSPLPESPWLRYGLAEGALVAGKYRLQAILGEGGMGLVVSAHHEALERMVALKVLRKESAKDPVIAERFLREARAAANLRSEHVVHVLDVGTLPTGAPSANASSSSRVARRTGHSGLSCRSSCRSTARTLWRVFWAMK